MAIKLHYLGLLCLAGQAVALPQEARYAGGIALVPLPEYAPLSVNVRFNGYQVPIIQQANGSRMAVVGLPLSTPTGHAELLLNADNFTDQLSIDINPKAYPEQRITLKATNKVNPNEEELARYSREAAEQKAVYQSFNPYTSQWPAFRWPIQGEISSPFGLKRFFNGEARDPHSGLDIAAPEGKTIYAPADGIVAQIGDYFFNGKTVMIDHGQGIISMLCHLSQIDVEKGQTLKAGQRVGKVGQTGRATGPHLHFGLSINNARVDPLLVLPPSP
ncbi:peptidoglycan DD-metalloendopeptidase family protein [Agitococcus lubricus]|uniref:Peptidase M23-like protein n=1 Tax=Agitococcus lubricus TaxID=1077255 RepID=A0A2T5J2S5_9GAMM|nr:peptidoglycan DD-metalloendopeptidase family protein [Agitococcus lubricus]PTQ90819.1 peptidase M23-like protein [Agitococcus lubricus]